VYGVFAHVSVYVCACLCMCMCVCACFHLYVHVCMCVIGTNDSNVYIFTLSQCLFVTNILSHMHTQTHREGEELL